MTANAWGGSLNQNTVPPVVRHTLSLIKIFFVEVVPRPMVVLGVAGGGDRVINDVEELATYITDAAAALLRSNNIAAVPKKDKVLEIT